MPHVNALVTQPQLHLRRKFEQAQEIGYRGAFFPYAFTKSFLCQRILVNQLLECQGDFDCVEVLTLDVLDKGHLRQFGIIGCTYICRNRCQSGALCCPETAFPGYYLVCVIPDFTERQRLYDAQLTYRCRQLIKRFFIKCGTRLVGIGGNERKVNVIYGRSPAGRDIIHGYKGVKPPA